MTIHLPKRWLIFAGATIIALAASRLWMIPLHFSPDPNEGWNAFQALRATGRGPLYPPADALTGNNYPPLSFLIVGMFGGLIGDQIVAGRIVALVSVIGIAGLVAMMVRRLAGTPKQAACGALLFLLLNASFLRRYLGLDDPQWLGQLLMTAALPLLVSRSTNGRASGPRVAAAALLMLAGGLVKQNLVAWPVAGTVWLSIYYPRSLIIWLLTVVVAGSVVLAACWIEYGPALIHDTLGVAREYSFARMGQRALPSVAVMSPLLWWTWPLVRQREADERIDLILLAILFATPLGIIQRSGAGVDINAHFEAFVALSMAAPLATAHSSRHTCIAVAFISALMLVGLASEVKEVGELPQRRAAWSAMERRIAGIRGPVACEIQALCYWAGKDFELDFFLYSQRAMKTRSATLLDRALSERRWSAVMIAPDGPHDSLERLRDPVLARVTSSMHPVFVDADGRRLMYPD